MKQKLDWGFIIRNFVLFILVVPVGTLLHEFGHYFAAKLLGIDMTIRYSYTKFLGEFDRSKYIYIIIGGILSTIIMGTVGLILLLRSKPRTILNVSLKNHIFILLTLFWSRELAFIIAGISYLLFKRKPYFGGDEGRVDLNFGWPNGTSTIVLGTIAFFILYWVTFKFVPKHLRLSFIISSFAGIGLGVYLWFFKLGPYLLP